MPKKSKHPGLRSHSWRTSGGEIRTAYYLDNRGGAVQEGGPAEIPLGTDYAAALEQWRKLKLLKPLEAGTIKEALDEWEQKALPAYLSATTRRDYALCLKQLRPVFAGARWDDVGMPTLRGYLDARTGKTRANRELAVLSIVWNWAILRGMTKLPFPAAGLQRSKWKNKERPRDIDVTPALFGAVYAEADQVLRDAMDIASATGLRLMDVVSVGLPSDGVLRLAASKTGKRAAFDVASSPVLSALLERRKTYRVSHLKLLSTPKRDVSLRMLSERWDAARSRAAGRRENRLMMDDLKRLILRDMRKLAANEAADLRDAADLLQHDDQRLTARHYRLKVTPRKAVR